MKGKSSTVLLALAIAALAPSLAIAQYAPNWHVGDWWVTKKLGQILTDCGIEWLTEYTRYEILGVEKVGDRDCFVLEVRPQSRPDGAPAKIRQVFYVRRDDWLVVRWKWTLTFGDSLLPERTEDCPLGLFGPVHAAEPRLPRFPLRLDDPDTTFKLKRRHHGKIEMREISTLADRGAVNRFLDEGDSANVRVVRPTGPVYQVRVEAGGNLAPGPLADYQQIVQSLQLWCDNLPWRLYEEIVTYVGVRRVRSLNERTWLIAVGRSGK